MSVVQNITHCEHCNTELETVAITDERPRQTLKRHCPSCDTHYWLAMQWYPNNRNYELVGTAPAATQCGRSECTADATVISISDTDVTATVRCDECGRADIVAAIDIARSDA